MNAPIQTSEMTRVFGRIGVLSFGGPAAQIALMHKELVEDRDWLTEGQFLRALSFCMLLPGPEAMQLATYAGWRMRGILGGLIAGGLFVLPGAAVIMVLALAYASFGALPWVQGLFLGVQAAVVVIIIAALRKVASKALKGSIAYALAVASFLTLFFFNVPFPVVILAAGIIGALALPRPDAPVVTAPAKLDQSLGVILIGSMIWFAPIALLWLLDAAFLTQVALFFSKLAVVTFGGAYAVLAYMTQAVVGDLGWLSTPQMMDALGLAETTPGPLILVTQFVAMVAGQAEGGWMLAIVAGILTLWVTFVPCFIWIFAGAPLIDWLEGQARLQAALKGITAAVVGVIANLSLWFALHVLFSRLSEIHVGPLRLLWPEVTSLDPIALGLALLAGYAMLWRGWGMILVMCLCAGISLLITGMG